MRATLLVLVAMFSSLGLARPYKYYLNPLTAEQMLGSIHLHPRLANEEWLRLINFDKNEKRTVQPGDNLWNISRARFGDPFLWRKLWQENAWLTNPHELEVGRVLAYYNEERENEAVKTIPIVKLRPAQKGSIGDVENDIVINRVLKNRYRLTFVIVSDDELLGEVTGAYTLRNQLSVNEDFYTSFYNSKQAEPGSRFAVVRKTQELRDKTQVGSPLIGNLARILGEISVIKTENGLTRVELVRQFEPIERGDLLMLMPQISLSNAGEYPSRDLIPQIVMGQDLDKNLIQQGDLVLLNKGQSHGMRDGYLFKVFEDTDPLKDSRSVVSPDSKGEVRIVFVGAEYSVGVVNRNREPLAIGDSLVSFPELPDRPISPKKELKEISID